MLMEQSPVRAGSPFNCGRDGRKWLPQARRSAALQETRGRLRSQPRDLASNLVLMGCTTGGEHHDSWFAFLEPFMQCHPIFVARDHPTGEKLARPKALPHARSRSPARSSATMILRRGLRTSDGLRHTTQTRPRSPRTITTTTPTSADNAEAAKRRWGQETALSRMSRRAQPSSKP